MLIDSQKSFRGQVVQWSANPNPLSKDPTRVAPSKKGRGFRPRESTGPAAPAEPPPVNCACERGFPLRVPERDYKAVRRSLAAIIKGPSVEAFGNVYIIRFVQSAARNRTFVRHEMKMKLCESFLFEDA